LLNLKGYGIRTLRPYLAQAKTVKLNQ
jgi:hypothetical protein